MLRVLLSGQRSFGAAAAELVACRGHELVGVIAPREDEKGRPDRLRLFAEREALGPIHDALTPAHVPEGTDVILAAHSHAFVGRRSRARARVAIGYHPSLLPLHRGRDAVRWAARDRDRVVGGSVYHLTDNVDAGPLAAQGYRVVRAGLSASQLWRDVLFPLGLELLDRTLADLDTGLVVAVAQDEQAATWEPSWDRPPLHRPELPELPSSAGDWTWTADPAALRSEVR